MDNNCRVKNHQRYQVAKYLVLSMLLLLTDIQNAFAQAELPVLLNTPQNAKVMLQIDDSGSMNAVVEHADFDVTDPAVTNAANTIPDIIFRVNSGVAAPATTTLMTPMLIALNYNYFNSSTGNLWADAALNAPTSFPAVAASSCNNTSASNVCCPGTSGSSCPKTGINTLALYGNSAVTGAAIFATANLATFSSSTVVDSSGNEFLYASFRKNDYETLTDTWQDVWPKFDASGNLVTYHTTPYATTGGTVVFNGKEVFLSAGWYRIEYLRWIFYVATAEQLAALPGVNRMQTVKNVVTQLILNNANVSFGISSLNGSAYTAGVHSGSVGLQWYTPEGDATNLAPKVRAVIGTSSASLITTLNQLTSRGGTPLTNTYIENLRYFAGVSDLDPNFSGTYTSPITAQCDSHNIIVLTDGLPTSESGKKLPNNAWVTNLDGDPDGATSNNGCSSPVCENFWDDAAWYGYHIDFKTSVAGIQNITTYVVGFGLGYSLLDKVAADGGTGTALTANNATEITDTLQNIVNTIFDTPTSGAGVATLDKLFGEQKVYQPSFFGDSWKGDINVYDYDSATKSLIYDYNMADVLGDRNLSLSPRNIIAGLDTDHDGKTTQTVTFSTANVATLKPELFYQFSTSAESSTLLMPPLAAYTTDLAATTLINYISGNEVSGLRVRNRDNIPGRVDRLGDIVYSKPVEVGPRNGNYNSLSGYAAYVSSLGSEPRILLVGSNDGMLHAFDSLTGEEKWAYIPSSLLRHLEKLSRTNYPRQYRRSFVDGQIAVEDVYVNGAWKTYAMFGLRTGGSQFIVLDITDRDAPTLVWEVNDVASAGQSWNKPVVVISGGSATTNTPSSFNWYMVVGTGEAKATAGTNILAYSLSSSTPPVPTVVSISSSDPAGSRTTGIATVQGDADFNVDRLYLGTEEGDLYRVHVNGAPSSWAVQKLYDGANTQPIVATPLVVLADNPQYSSSATSGITSFPLAVGVYFGTGKYDVRNDITTYGTVTQSIFGIFDPLNTTADAYGSVLTNQIKTSLQNQTSTNFSVLRKSNGKYYTPASKSGFYIDLNTSITVATGNYINPVGEVVNSPINVLGMIVFTTFLPDTALCDIGGHGFVQGLHYQTGGGAVVDYALDPEHPFFNGGIQDIQADNDYDATDLSLGFSTNKFQAVLDMHVESIDTTLVNPYVHDGELLLNDMRLHSTNGGFIPSVSSVGHTGLPSSPAFLASQNELVIQPAYPSDPGSGASSGSGSSGSEPPEGELGSTTTLPPPTTMPLNVYNLPVNVISFHEGLGQ